MKLKKLVKQVTEEMDLKGRSFVTTPTKSDSDTRTFSWDVTYEPDFAQLLKDLIKAEKSALGILTDKELGKDKFLKDVASEIKYLKNTYRDHLRNNYPGQYEIVKRKVKQN